MSLKMKMYLSDHTQFATLVEKTGPENWLISRSKDVSAHMGTFTGAMGGALFVIVPANDEDATKVQEDLEDLEVTVYDGTIEPLPMPIP